MDITIEQLLIIMGVPTAITGLLVWWFKRHIDKRDKENERQEKNKEKLMLMILQSTRANSVVCKATAEAVRDGHCNGNMTNALKIMEAVQKEEKDFLMEQGIKHIFDE